MSLFSVDGLKNLRQVDDGAPDRQLKRCDIFNDAIAGLICPDIKAKGKTASTRRSSKRSCFFPETGEAKIH